MKIAFCISGHLRTYKNPIIQKNFFEFKDYISSFGEVDIFVSTWNRQNTERSWSASHNLHDPLTISNYIDEHDILQHYGARSVKILDYDYYSSIYSPLNYKYFTKKEYSWDERAINNNILHSTKMFYLIYRVNQLKTKHEYINSFTYDYVFRIRPDHLFDLQECKIIDLNRTQKDVLYIPYLNDRFAYGSSYIMNQYSSTIFNVALSYDNNIFGDPEHLQIYSIKNLIDSAKIVKIPMCGQLLADNGTLR